MASLVTVADLTSRLQRGTLDTDAADDAVTGASGLVRAIARQEISLVSQETVTLAGGERVLTLPQRPVVVDGSNPLTVVELGEFGGADAILTEDTDYSRLGNELTRGYPWWSGSGRLMGWPRMRPAGIWAPRVQVTYTHGEATVGDDVVAIVLDVASVLYDNPTALRSVSIDDYSETKASEMLGAAMVEAIKAKLGATGRRRRAFSIRT